MLSDKQCKAAVCPSDKKSKRFYDERGLYLQVSASSKRWFFKYSVEGVEKRLAIGSYPETTLAGARNARDEARAKQTKGIDPVSDKMLEKLTRKTAAARSFEAVANEWFEQNKPGWSNSHAIRERRNLDKDLLPHFAARPIADIKSIQMLAAVRLVQERSLSIAHRVLSTASQVFKYAVATARTDHNVCADIQSALPRHRKKHFGATTDPVTLGQLLLAIKTYQGGMIVRTALQLAPMLFQRPNELRGMAWAEVDLEKALWTIPSARMKRTQEGKLNGQPHLVPLPTQAVALLTKLKPFTGHSTLCFHGERSHDRPISDNTLRAALLTLGYSSDTQTIHGFRATARTLLAETLCIDPLIIEAQLAHEVKDANGRAYNRTTYINQRAEMMQKWADYLDSLQKLLTK